MKQLTEKIIDLRLRGKTYNEIKYQLQCSKGHISYVCKRYVNNNDLISAFNKKNMDRQDSLAKARHGARIYYANKLKECKKEYLNKLRTYPDQNFIYYICGLYEGDGNHYGRECNFTNSGFRLILAFQNHSL